MQSFIAICPAALLPFQKKKTQKKKLKNSITPPPSCAGEGLAKACFAASRREKHNIVRMIILAFFVQKLFAKNYKTIALTTKGI